jgi:hypothetical protein
MQLIGTAYQQLVAAKASLGAPHVFHLHVGRQAFDGAFHYRNNIISAPETKVEPTRIRFVYALSLVWREWQRANAPRAAIGNVPRDLATFRLNLKRLVPPPRRSNSSIPRAVKLRMSNYARERTSAGVAK